MNIQTAVSIAGTLSIPSKMPGYAYSLPAKECITGSKLRKIKGSTCFKCYAFRGNYLYGNVQTSMYKRLAAIRNPLWVRAMITLIENMRFQVPYFRWHDSGDIQSLNHLRKIVLIALALPDIRFWLPTREYVFVKAYQSKFGAFPENLCVRVSAHMIDGPVAFISDLPTSGVHSAENPPNAFICPARTQGNVCGSCRSCWTLEVKHVSYHLH